jgi:hypothetical protein
MIPQQHRALDPKFRYLILCIMHIFYPFRMTSWEAILTKEVIVPSPTMSANVINKDNEGPAKKLIFPARRRLQLACIGLVVCGLRSTGPKIDRLPP